MVITAAPMVRMPAPCMLPLGSRSGQQTEAARHFLKKKGHGIRGQWVAALLHGNRAHTLPAPMRACAAGLVLELLHGIRALALLAATCASAKCICCLAHMQLPSAQLQWPRAMLHFMSRVHSAIVQSAVSLSAMRCTLQLNRAFWQSRNLVHSAILQFTRAFLQIGSPVHNAILQVTRAFLQLRSPVHS